MRGGAGERGHGSKPSSLKYAVQWRLPLVRLLDAVGGSVRTFEQLGRTYLPDSPGTTLAVELLNQVPVVSAVMGSVAGLPAIEACLCHFNVMVKGSSQVFAGGPPVVKAALGYEITKEYLGDYRSQVIKSGVIDNLAYAAGMPPLSTSLDIPTRSIQKRVCEGRLPGHHSTTSICGTHATT